MFERQEIGTGMLMDSSLLILCLLWSQPGPGSVGDGEGCWQ